MHAIVYTEEAVEHRTSFKRRMRWLTGYTQCNKKYRKAVVKKRLVKARSSGRILTFSTRFFPFISSRRPA